MSRLVDIRNNQQYMDTLSLGQYEFTDEQMDEQTITGTIDPVLPKDIVKEMERGLINEVLIEALRLRDNVKINPEVTVERDDGSITVTIMAE